MRASFLLSLLFLLVVPTHALGQTSGGSPQTNKGQVPDQLPQGSSQAIHLSDHLGVTDAVKVKMQTRLSAGASDELYIFDNKGELQKQIPLTHSALEKYPSVVDLVRSNSSPISGCTDPKSLPPPPPGCVICSSGRVVCAKGFKKD